MLIAFNKPYGVLTQFTDPNDRATLADYIDQPGIYPAGRLDRDSEGLLLLTDDGKLQARIATPGKSWKKTYLVQVEGLATVQQLRQLSGGVELRDGKTQPAEVELVARAPGWLWKRPVAISPRQGKALSWLQITLNEGRNRQVRRMTAAVGLPTLRLIRQQVGPIKVQRLQPGESIVVTDYVRIGS